MGCLGGEGGSKSVFVCVCVGGDLAEKEEALLYWYSGCQQTRVIAGSL